MTNVVQLRQQVPPPPPPPGTVPWHEHEAKWILYHVERFALNITKWDRAFVRSMVTWDAHVTPMQHKILRSIGDKVERALKKMGVQLPPPQAPSGPDDAA